MKGVATINLFEVAAKIKLDNSDYTTGVESAEKKTTKFEKSLKAGLATAAKVGAVGLAASTAAVAAFGKKSVSTGMEFDAAMSQVAATMGKTTDEIKNLRDFAQQMGATTSFSATQSAEALNYMALAGYDAETSMKMLPNVLNLAAAGGIDLAYASDMVTDASSALGLSLDETTELVDKMAKSSSKSNTSVAQLGEAILTVGGTAKNLAGGTTELSTALGILADNGIKGAEGGTALRNIILSLTAPTDSAGEAIKSLGIEVFDAEGNMRPLNETFNDLNEVLSTMSQGEQTQALNEIFNKVDLKSVNALLANSGERFTELSAAIDDASGAAQKMADTQLDNLAGDVTLFKSALEGTQIAVSDKLTPAIRDFVQIGSGGLQSLTDAITGNKGLDEIINVIGSTFQDILAKLTSILPKIIEFGGKILLSLAQGLINSLPQIAVAATDILVTLGKGLGENLPQLMKSAAEVITSIVIALTEPETLKSLMDAALSIIVGLVNGLVEALPVLIDAIPSIIGNLQAAFIENLPQIIEAGVDIIMALNNGLIASIPLIIAALPEIFVSIIEAFRNVDWLQLGANIIQGLKDGIINGVRMVKDAINQLISSFVGYFKRLLGINSPSKIFADFGVNIIQGLINGITSLLSNLANTASTIVSYVKDAIVEKVDAAREWGRDLLDNFIGGITDKLSSLWDTVSGVASGIKDFLGFSEPKKGPLSNFHTYAPDMMALFAQGIKDNTRLITDQISRSFDFGDLGGATFSTFGASAIPTAGAGYSASNNANNAVTGLLSEILATMQKMGVYIDGDALVGALSPGMQNQFAMSAMRAR